jgi:hypothetical protein
MFFQGFNSVSAMNNQTWFPPNRAWGVHLAERMRQQLQWLKHPVPALMSQCFDCLFLVMQELHWWWERQVSSRHLVVVLVPLSMLSVPPHVLELHNSLSLWWQDWARTSHFQGIAWLLPWPPKTCAQNNMHEWWENMHAWWKQCTYCWVWALSLLPVVEEPFTSLKTS